MRRFAPFYAIALLPLALLLGGCAAMKTAARTQGRAEDVVAKALQSPARDERLQATRIAADVADAALDPLLAQRLGDDDAAIRATAAAALAKSAAPARDVLGAALAGNDAEARVIAVDGMRALPEWRALLAKLARDPDVRVRARVATAIGQLHPPDARSLLSALLHDGDAGVRGQALYGLAALDDRGALGEVAAALDDDALGVRLAALGALVRIARNDAAPRLLALAAGNDPYLAARAAVSLSRVGQPRAALAALTQAARDRQPAVRSAAMNAADSLGDDGVALATAALDDRDFDVRLDAARALVALHHADAALPVLRAFAGGSGAPSCCGFGGDDAATSPVEARRLDARAELARLGDRAALAQLVASTKDACASMRAAAYARIFPLAAGRALVDAALADADSRIRLHAAAIALGRAFRQP
jgi:HEAT repeat protein